MILKFVFFYFQEHDIKICILSFSETQIATLLKIMIHICSCILVKMRKQCVNFQQFEAWNLNVESLSAKHWWIFLNFILSVSVKLFLFTSNTRTTTIKSCTCSITIHTVNFIVLKDSRMWRKPECSETCNCHLCRWIDTNFIMLDEFTATNK